MPIGWPAFFSFGAALRTWSHVVGASPTPAPEVVPPDDRVGHVVVGDGEVLLRLRVVGRQLGERAHLPDLLGRLRDDVLVVDHLVLVDRRRREELEDVVAALRGDLRGGARVELRVRDVVDGDVDVVLLAPLLAPRLVEPRRRSRARSAPIAGSSGRRSASGRCACAALRTRTPSTRLSRRRRSPRRRLRRASAGRGERAAAPVARSPRARQTRTPPFIEMLRR